MFAIGFTKENFKFSCAHFTIFGPKVAERLHGHNYQVRLGMKVDKLDPSLGLAFDFNAVKPMIRAACDRLDEHILLPLGSPHLRIHAANGQVDVQFADKRYSFPEGDTIQLPVANITSEELARHLADEFAVTMKELPGWIALEVHVEEMRGQSVSYTRPR